MENPVEPKWIPVELPISQEVLWPSEPHLSLYSTKNELGEL
jgi:hypothetical protein